jgi:hypothetical protein
LKYIIKVIVIFLYNIPDCLLIRKERNLILWEKEIILVWKKKKKKRGKTPNAPIAVKQAQAFC